MHNLDSVKRHHGMTIIEVMIALTIGLLITAAIASMFISMSKSYKQNDAIARLQENARFALELMTQDLRHAGYFGNVADPGFVNITRGPTTNVDSCGGTLGTTVGIYNFQTPGLVLSYGNTITSDPATLSVNINGVNTNIYNTCLTADDIPTDGSSILLVKRTATTHIPETPTDQRVSGVIYVRSNGSTSELYSLANDTSLSEATNLEYQPHIYYIDGNDTLQRKYLRFDNPPTLVSEPLAQGIDAFHIEFGIDPDRNGTPEYYYSPDAGTIADPDILADAVSATIYILARTTVADPDHSDGKTYQLGGMNRGPYNDRFHRRVYTASTSLKNIRHQVILRQGI